jgi:hypothetical protein
MKKTYEKKMETIWNSAWIVRSDTDRGLVNRIYSGQTEEDLYQ